MSKKYFYNKGKNFRERLFYNNLLNYYDNYIFKYKIKDKIKDKIFVKPPSYKNSQKEYFNNLYKTLPKYKKNYYNINKSVRLWLINY
tara:strand:- start:752 stop:1012 length:261 start_codon:yes stop_codon:yes gene_type:complete